ncbi:hypothetical protein SDJN03_15853, partial [Cucurbita argyrosperma subsp. sororia]
MLELEIFFDTSLKLEDYEPIQLMEKNWEENMDASLFDNTHASESEPESESETESESEYNSSLYQSESTSESPFKEECVLAPIGTPIRVIRLLRTSGPASPSDRLVIDYVFKVVLAFQFLCPNSVRSPCFRFFLSYLLSVEERKGFLQAGKLELFLPCYFSIPDLAGFEADANNALAAGRFRFHSNTSVCCKGDRSASGDYGPQRKIRSVLQTALSHTGRDLNEDSF